MSPTIPPFYSAFGVVVWPLGWRGLVLINALAFFAVGWMVFHLAKRHAASPHAPWVALSAFALGGFSLDYAQGAWPHMLSAALTTLAVWLCVRAWEERGVVAAALAGLAVGVAAGVRFQNVVFAGALGLTLLLWARRRWRTSLAFAGGAGLPLLGMAVINSVRLGSPNPINKGAKYLTSSAGAEGAHPVVDSLMTLWVRIVDYSAHPPFVGTHASATLPKDPHTGAFVVIGGLKKSLLQSAPWAAVALAVLIWAWWPRSDQPSAARRLLRALSVVVCSVLALFAWAGLERHDGWSFNQRYLFELVPLLAVALAMAVDKWKLDRTSTVLGVAIGAALAALPLAVAPEHPFRQRMLMYGPLVLAVGLLVAWWMAQRRDRWSAARAGALAACVGWALAVHVGDDMRWARARRGYHQFQYDAMAAALPHEPVALFAYLGQKEATCRLYFDRDIVVVDPYGDDGRDAAKLVGELLDAGRRVFVVGGIPAPILRSMFEGRRFQLVSKRPIPIGEVLRPGP